MDVLADVLVSLNLKAGSYFCNDFASPWGMLELNTNNGLFHAVIRGNCLLQIEGHEETIALTGGDIVAFPTGGAHSIFDRPDTQLAPATKTVSKLISGENPFEGPNSQITLMCGYFSYDLNTDHPFLQSLPHYIHLRTGENDEFAWLRSLIRNLSRETRLKMPGSSVVVDRLSEILFVQLLRDHIASQSLSGGYLRALSHKQIGKALQLIHAEPSNAWTLDILAKHTAMSRTAFATKFTQLVGQPAGAYVLCWRMLKAREYLDKTQMNVADIAEQVGYGSEAAFSKAFKNNQGISPAIYRRQRRSGETG